MEGISILAIKGLGHEGGVKVVLCCYLLGHIIEKHGPISCLQRIRTLQVDLVLRRSDLMVRFLILDATLFQDIDDFVPYHLSSVMGVAMKIAGTVRVHILIETIARKQKELMFRPRQELAAIVGFCLDQDIFQYGPGIRF
jgi:hypothetical protein